MSKTPVKDRILQWDILALADQVLDGKSSTDYQFFKANFNGNCLDLFYDRNGQLKPAKPRAWKAKIMVHAQADDGTDHRMEFDFNPDAKTTLKQLMDGITPYWLDECDRDLKDMTCISAIAVAKCRG